MPKVYADLIKKDVKKFSQVPVKLQDEVRAVLLASNLDENGGPVDLTST